MNNSLDRFLAKSQKPLYGNFFVPMSSTRQILLCHVLQHTEFFTRYAESAYGRPDDDAGDGTAKIRTHNTDNELTAVDGENTSCDAKGNMTEDVEEQSDKLFPQKIFKGRSIKHLYFFHSQLVDRIDLSTAAFAKGPPLPLHSSVGKSGGLSEMDKNAAAHWKKGISAVGDNGKSHRWMSKTEIQPKWHDIPEE